MIKKESNLLNINLQLFAEGDEPTPEDLLSMFGIEPEPKNDTPPADTATTDPVDPPADTIETVDPTDPPADNPEEPPASDPPDPTPDKTAKAFAQMRVQNKQLNETLKGIAAVLKVDTSDPDAMSQKLQDLILDAQAKQQNLDPAIYKRLTAVEQENQAFKQQKTQEAAYIGFQKVKETFKIDNNELNAFADTLIQQGRNPFEQPLDLINEYKTLNFDKIVQQRIDEAVRKEQERSAKAANQSSTPNQGQGTGEGDPEKITTIEQLTAFMNKQTQK